MAYTSAILSESMFKSIAILSTLSSVAIYITSLLQLLLKQTNINISVLPF
jgi:hypothetical protein